MDKAEYHRNWEVNNKDKRRRINKAYRTRQRNKLANLKREPCTDCGVRYNPWQMQWDHVGTDKEFTIGSKVIDYSWDRVLAEIAKCDLVCANCHADRTWNRRLQ